MLQCISCAYTCLQVPSRLAQLLVYLGPSASLSDVLALTKRCPQVLQVSRAVLVGRMMQLCSLLGRDPAAEVSQGVLWVGYSPRGQVSGLRVWGWGVLVGCMMQLRSLLRRDPAADASLGAWVSGFRCAGGAYVRFWV
jgi:hypothetical protein